MLAPVHTAVSLSVNTRPRPLSCVQWGMIDIAFTRWAIAEFGFSVAKASVRPIKEMR